jgi:hypothetical protein
MARRLGHVQPSGEGRMLGFGPPAQAFRLAPIQAARTAGIELMASAYI